MTPIQAAECCRADAIEAVEQLHQLVRECCQQIAAAKAAELDARNRADRLSQILTSAAGLADMVLRGEYDEARSIATMVAIRIGALTP